MANAVMILFAAVFTSNIALTYLLGMCPFIALSKKMSTSVGMGIAVTVVITLTGIINWPIYYYILVPLKAMVLEYIVFILTIAALVQILEILIDRFAPALAASFGIFLPLIAVNCAVLAVSLFIVLRDYTFLQTVAFSFGSGFGWMFAIVIIAGMREKMELFSNVPKGLIGPGITLILAGILSMAFTGFGGMLKIK